MEEQFKVFYAGQLMPGIDPEEAIAGFCQRFGVAEERGRKLVESSQPVLLKKGISEAQAEKYRQAMEAIGLVVNLEAMPSEASTLELVPMEEEAEQTSGGTEETAKSPVCPKCGSERIENDNCLDCGVIISKFLEIQARKQEEEDDADEWVADPAEANPYAVPQSELVGEPELGTLAGPESVPAGHGWAWVVRGFWHFRQNPFAWIIAMVVWVVISIIASFIPFIGSLAVTLVSPVIMVGFLLGADAQEQGRDFEVGHLFAGFSSNVGQLVLVGLLYLVGMIVIFFVIAMIGGGALVAMMGGAEGMAQQDPEVVAATFTSPAFLLMPLLALALTLPLVMAYWFAPALIAFGDMSAVSAMRTSFSGCLKNILPFLLYGVIALVLMILGALPLFLGWLVVFPVLGASIYVSYKDIFYS